MSIEYGDYIYIIGGELPSLVDIPVATVYAYNPKTNEWRVKAPMPGAKMASSMCVYNDKLYVIGGLDGANADNITDSVYEYDFINNSWRIIDSLDVKRAYSSCVVYNDVLYVIGGGGGETSIEKYSASNHLGDWEMVNTAALSLGKGYHTSIVYDDRILVIGGAEYYGSGFSSTIESFKIDLSSNLQNNSVSSLELELLNPLLIVDNGDMKIIAGYHDEYAKMHAREVVLNQEGGVEINQIADQGEGFLNIVNFIEYEEEVYSFFPLMSLDMNSLNQFAKYNRSFDKWDYVSKKVLNRVVSSSIVNDESVYFIADGKHKKIDLKTGDIIGLSSLDQLGVNIGGSYCSTHYEGNIYTFDIFRGQFNSYNILSNQWGSAREFSESDDMFQCVQNNNNVYFIDEDGEIRIFDLISKQLTNVNAVNPQEYMDLRGSVVFNDDKIYLVGGIDHNYDAIDIVQYFDLTTKQWMVGEPLIDKRQFSRNISLNSSVYAFFGMGFGGGVDPSVAKFDGENWMEIGMFKGKESSLLDNYGLKAGKPLLYKGKVYFIGGEMGYSWSNQIWTFY